MESSMILPVVILTVAAVIFISITLYASAVMEYSMHMGIREGAGLLSGTSFREDTKEKAADRKKLYGTLTGEEEIGYMVKKAEELIKEDPLDINVKGLEGSFEVLRIHQQLKIYGDKQYGGFGLLAGFGEKRANTRWALKDPAGFARNADLLIEGVK